MSKKKTLISESTMRRFAKLANIPAIGASTLREKYDMAEEDLEEGMHEDEEAMEEGMHEDEEAMEEGMHEDEEAMEEGMHEDEEAMEEGMHEDDEDAPAPDLDEPQDMPLDLEPEAEPAAEDGVVKGELNIKDLVDDIAAAITKSTGVNVQAQEADLGDEMGDEVADEMDAGDDLGDLGDMAPGPEDEEMMAESYIREKVRQALISESKGKQQPSEFDERVNRVYQERMQSIAQKVYDQARNEVLAESKTNALSDELQKRVLTRILEDTKK
jgi:hypothetical protein